MSDITGMLAADRPCYDHRMSRSIVVVLAFLGLLACKGNETHGSSTSGSASSEGHTGIKDGAAAFAKALATREVAKVRAEMPPRDVLAKYFACDTIGKRIDDTAARAVAQSTAVPDGGTFAGVQDTQTQIIDTELDGCRVTEQILVVTVATLWNVGADKQGSSLALVRLGKRWYGFDVP
jgi:hypothetical protein